MDPRARSWPRMIGRWLRNSVRESPRMAPLNVADYRDAGLRRVVATFQEAMRDRPEDKLPRVVVPGMPHMIPFRGPRALVPVITDFA
ncbi:hypothetical protein [Nonomuraea sp. 10N515B]|uniref:hypothetical protein n=1 Tax=Nonomuraea sp. 10N515B TaxID=3457422 RepID=UPI003FCEB748